jgi:protein arginine kinase activator
MKCGKPATHKFTRIQDGQIYDLYLCSEHAAEMSPYQKPKQVPLSEILEGLLKQDLASKGGGATGAPEGLRCEACGLTLSNYRKNLLLGCSRCYESFHDYLVIDLRRFHGAARHCGRMPGGGTATPPPPELPREQLELESAGPVPKTETEPSPTKGGENLIKDRERAVEELTQAMKKAIEKEDYERAARYRDQIRQIRESQKKESGK